MVKNKTNMYVLYQNFYSVLYWIEVVANPIKQEKPRKDLKIREEEAYLSQITTIEMETPERI